MKMNEVTKEVMGKYLQQINDSITDFKGMFKEIDKYLLVYGQLHYKFAHNEITMAYAKQEKDKLISNSKNAMLAQYNNIIESLKTIRDEYISKELMPSKSTLTDPVELSLIEKELKVMSDAELFRYYEENYMIDSISRLCIVEYKARKRDDGKLAPLPEFKPNDDVIKAAEDYISKYVAIRQLISSTCVFISIDPETKSWIPKMIAWDVIFKQIENRNHSSNITTTLDYFVQKSPSEFSNPITLH